MNRYILFSVFMLAGLAIGGGGLWVATANGVLAVPSYESSLAQQSDTTSTPEASKSQDTTDVDTSVVASNSNTSPAVVTPPEPNFEDQCHTLAGHPQDPELVGVGVSDADMDIEAAITACRTAVAENPDDPTLNFQLGRAFQLQGLIDEAEKPLSVAAQFGYAAAMTHYAQLYVGQQNDIETLKALIEYAEDSLAGGYQPAQELLDLLNAQLTELEALMNPPFDPSLFQNKEIMKALWERDFSTLDNIKSNFYIEDYGVPKTVSEYAIAFAQQLNGIYQCPILLEAGVDAKIQSSLEQAISNATVRNPAQSLQMVGGMLQQMMGNGGSMQSMANSMADMNDRVSRGTSLSAKLAQQGMKDAVTIKERYGCDGNVSITIAKNIADYAYGRY